MDANVNAFNLNNNFAPTRIFATFRTLPDFIQAVQGRLHSRSGLQCVVDRVYRGWLHPSGFFYVSPTNSSCNPNNETQNRACFYYLNYHIAKLNNSIVLESARSVFHPLTQKLIFDVIWGDMSPKTGSDNTYYGWTHFQAEVNRLQSQFFAARPATFRTALNSLGMLPTIGGIDIQASGQQVTMTALGSSPQTIRYTLNGTDPRAPGGSVSVRLL